MSSVDGQIMPPVMGAAAFLMVEYVGIPYSEIVRNAILPATLYYIGLFYIVHLEALKLGMKPIVQRRPRTLRDKALRLGFGVSGTILVVAILYYVLDGVRALFGDAAPYVAGVIVVALYLGAAWMAARCPDLPDDIDIDQPRALETWPAVKAGLHFLLPVGMLIWCLMIEEMSPALSAFWAIVVLVGLMLTQRPLIAAFRRTPAPGAWKRGALDVVHGLADGSRNMIGIGVATATAGIVVGAITLTGIALRMTEFVEFVSQGNVMVMLLFIAFVCLVLGLGVPTTANYVLVATLMAPVVVELGAQAGLVIPLIAVHLFVFYYGIIGDITPPVGLATFAAAAISGEDAIATGIQGAIYAMRTVILPFIWIFNPALLLIDIDSVAELVIVVLASMSAMLVFAAITMWWFRVRCRFWEVLVLGVACLLLFRPDFFMDQLTDEYTHLPASKVYDVARELPAGGRLVMVIRGQTIEGDEVQKTVALRVGAPDDDGRKRLAEAGVTLAGAGDALRIAGVKFGSRARKSGCEQGWGLARVEVPSGRASPYWFYLPAILLIALVWWSQGRRMAPEADAPARA
jgi:TRAP transporter 4TM/12TM fusion protein